MLAGEQARTVEATGRQSAVLAGLLIISIRIAYQYKLAQLRLNSRPQRDPEQPFSAAHKGQRQSLIGTCRSSRKVLDQCCIWLATKTVDAAHEVASPSVGGDSPARSNTSHRPSNPSGFRQADGRTRSRLHRFGSGQSSPISATAAARLSSIASPPLEDTVDTQEKTRKHASKQLMHGMQCTTTAAPALHGTPPNRCTGGPMHPPTPGHCC